MASVCPIRVEQQGPESVLLSVRTTYDLTGRVVEQWHLSDPEEVLSLVREFLDRSRRPMRVT
jgi:hypothetical protein